MNKPKHLTVIGGGITGLVIAYLAAKEGIKVRIIERSAECGGLLHTFPVGGTRLEYYYHHFFTHDKEIHWLLNDLGLSNNLVYSKSTMGIFSDGKIYPFNKPIDLLQFSSLSALDKLRFGLTTLHLGKLANWKNSENISCLDWFYKYAGSGSTNKIWKPLLTVKFGKYADEVPLTWMIGRLRQRMGSRRNVGEERLGYLRGSLQVLLDALMNRLTMLGVEVVTNARLTGLEARGSKVSSISTTNGVFAVEAVVSTIPTCYLAPILKTPFPKLANELDRIEYFGAICVVLELKKSLSPVYWLNIADSSMPFGGIIEHTNLIKPDLYNGKHIVYLSRYFSTDESIAQMGHQEIAELMMRALPNVFPYFSQDWITKTHTFKTNTAANVCDLNFSEKIPTCKTEVRNLFIAAMPHVYPDERSVNNSIRVAIRFLELIGSPASYRFLSNSLSASIGFQREFSIN